METPLSQSYLSQIESGARPHLTNTTRLLLAKFFKVHPGYLVDDPEEAHLRLLYRGERRYAAGRNVAVHSTVRDGERCAHALETTWRRDPNLYYEDVYHRLLPAQGGTLEAIAVSVGDLPWTEVDTIDDLTRAATIARRTRLTT